MVISGGDQIKGECIVKEQVPQEKQLMAFSTLFRISHGSQRKYGNNFEGQAALFCPSKQDTGWYFKY